MESTQPQPPAPTVAELNQQEALLQARIRERAKLVQTAKDPTLRVLAMKLVAVRTQRKRLLEQALSTATTTATALASSEATTPHASVSSLPKSSASHASVRPTSADETTTQRLSNCGLPESTRLLPTNAHNTVAPAATSNPATRHAEQVLQTALHRGDLALLRVSWMLNHHADLSCRQALPPEAFLSTSNLQQLNMNNVVVLSYMWLDPVHPDPDGATLRLVQRALRLLFASAENRADRVGLFWDFGSLYQHERCSGQDSVGRPRTPEQEAAFRRGLEAMPYLFLHPQTMVLQVTQAPNGSKKSAAYFQRGWTTVEYCWASLVKNHGRVYDLSRLQALDEPDKEVQYAWQLYELCGCRTRRTPLHPDALDQIAVTLKFANGKDDRPLVQRLYRQTCREFLPHVQCWNFAGLAWSAREAQCLLRFLDSAVLPRLVSLNLSHNQLGADFCRAFVDTVSDSDIPLQDLSLSGNPLGNAGVAALAPWAVSRLTTLRLAKVGGLSRQGCRALAACADSNKDIPRLVHLDLSDNALGPNVLAVLCSSSRWLARLEVLDLHRNGLGDAGCRLLCQLARNKDTNAGVAWKSLGLDDNDICLAGVVENLVDAIPRLESLSLRFNPVSNAIVHQGLEQKCQAQGVKLGHSPPLTDLLHNKKSEPQQQHAGCSSAG